MDAFSDAMSTASVKIGMDLDHRAKHAPRRLSEVGSVSDLKMSCQIFPKVELSLCCSSSRSISTIVSFFTCMKPEKDECHTAPLG